MRKTLFLLLFTATLGLVSCKKDNIVQNILPRTILADISTNTWKLTTDGKTYYAEIDVPENDNNFNQSGGVIVSLAFDSKKEVFNGLPYVVNGLSYTFTSEPGVVVVYLDRVDGQVPAHPLLPVRAKIVLVDSEIIN